MFKSYFKTGFRNILKHKGYSILNVSGLAMGMACCLLILLYVLDEKSYDKWLPDSERINRVAIDITSQTGDHLLFAPTSATLAPALLQYPQVQEAARIFKFQDNQVLVSDGAEKQFYENEWYMADPNIFKIFNYKFLAGNVDNALEAPQTVVLTKSTAAKYFGIQKNYSDVLNKSLTKNNKTYKVTGIIEDLPENSAFKPEFIASLLELKDNKGIMENWHATMFNTFIKLKVNTNAAAFEKEISNIADKYVGDEIKKNSQGYRYFLQPLTSIHLHSDLRYELSKNNSITYITIFSVAAIFILLIACINFINLATARATQRAKEVGVRKVIGAERRQLVIQFLCESFIISFASLIIAFVLVQLSLPFFNELAEKQLSAVVLFSPTFITLSLSVSFCVGLLAGLYPAFVLSHFKTSEIIKGKSLVSNKSGRVLRSGLVVGQFTISIIIIVASIIVSKQLHYLKDQSLGFDKEQLLVIHAPGGFLKEKFNVIRDELKKDPAVLSVSVSGSIPGRSTTNNLITLKGDNSKSTDMKLMQIDEKFLSTYNIPLAAGRNISERLSSDTAGDMQSILINEAALPFYGWKKPEDAIGKVFGGGWGTIVGVVKDFNYTSLQSKVAPLALFIKPRNYQYVSVKIKTYNLQNTISELANTWKSLTATHPVNYVFLDDDFNKQYLFENRLDKLISAFSFIAILIACLGLFGLASFTITQRTKEIGVRKVLGASITSIAHMLSMRFLKLVLLAVLIAIPLSWWGVNKWLADYAYRVNISWWIFLYAGALALLIALITVSYQAIRAATTNPIKSLRTE